MKQPVCGKVTGSETPPSHGAAHSRARQPHQDDKLPALATTEPCDDAQAEVDAVQLERLAAAILSKDHHDLAALAATNPMLVAEWHAAFRRKHLQALRRANYWSSAAAALATVKGLGVH